MDADFWLDVWQTGRTAFHKTTHEPMLVTHGHRLRLESSPRVLVPLAGKSLDMCWLRDQGASVTGVELSPIACAGFFEEQGLPAHRTAHGPYTAWASEGITLLQGDVFDLDEPLFDAFYDRAATVALDPTRRSHYADMLARHIRPGGKGLVLTFVFDPDEMSSPPFPVPPDVMHTLYGDAFDLEFLAEEDMLSRSQRARDRGMSSLRQHGWLLTRRNTRTHPLGQNAM